MGWVEARARRASGGQVRRAWHHGWCLLWRAIHCWAPVLHLWRVRSTRDRDTTRYFCGPLRVHGLLLLRRQLLLLLLLIWLWEV